MTDTACLAGVYPMLFALFGSDGSLSRSAMRRQVQAAVKQRPHGLAVLGLASEVNKLAHDERRAFLDWVAEDNAGELPLAVTIAEPSIGSQIEFIRAAKDVAASWVILQPPPVPTASEIELVRFFGAIADSVDIPIGIQIAPQYLGLGLGPQALLELNRQHPNISVLKLETTALGVARLREATDGRFIVFNGRGGIGMLECLKAGAAGIIPGGECYDKLALIYRQIMSGDEAQREHATAHYRGLLPLLVMLMDTIEMFLAHAKPILCRRLGAKEAAVRPPAAPPEAFGHLVIREYADRLGPL